METKDVIAPWTEEEDALIDSVSSTFHPCPRQPLTASSTSPILRDPFDRPILQDRYRLHRPSTRSPRSSSHRLVGQLRDHGP
jgi:hypothetical protein